METERGGRKGMKNQREIKYYKFTILPLSLSCHPRADCGGEFSFFRNDNGIIMSCGRGDQGVLGHKDCNLEDCLKPRLVEELLSTDTLSLSCGESHVVALTSDGEVFAWGNGKNGRLGTGNEEMWLVHGMT